jgi:uncharacterized protein (DUF2141 family)
MILRQFAFPLLLLSLTGASPVAQLSLEIANQRNARGVLHICVTAERRYFPDCSRDPAAIKRTVTADTRTLVLSGIPVGRAAVTIFHDENRNQKLDTTLGIPREGFGFSRNPVVRFGAPKFDQVQVQLIPGLNRQSVRMKYLL